MIKGRIKGTIKGILLLLMLLTNVGGSFIENVELDVTTLEPTLEPSFGPSYSPSLAFPIGPSYSPSLTFPINPSFSQSFSPSFSPSSIPKNILNFNIELRLNNVSNTELKSSDKQILLYAFHNITKIDLRYLSFHPFNLRKLTNGNYIDLIIYVLMPILTNENLWDLYNSYNLLVSDSFKDDTFITTITTLAKQYNSTAFTHIQIQLISISEPIIATSDTNKHDINAIKLSIIIAGILCSLTIVLGIIYMVKDSNAIKVHTDNIEDSSHGLRAVELTSS